MEPVDTLYSMSPLQLQGVPSDFPNQSSWDNFAEDFESFLEDQFQEDDVKLATVHAAEPITSKTPSAKRSPKPPKEKGQAASRPRPLNREQRRKMHNRAAQRVWREKQKVRHVHAAELPKASEAKILQQMSLVQSLLSDTFAFVAGPSQYKSMHRGS